MDRTLIVSRFLWNKVNGIAYFDLHVEQPVIKCVMELLRIKFCLFDIVYLYVIYVNICVLAYLQQFSYDVQ